MTASQFIAFITQSGNQLRISRETIPDQVIIQINLIAKGIIIENCVFESGFFIENVDLNCGIKFVECVFKKNLSINNCFASQYDHKFNFDGYHLDFNNTKIEALHFNGDNQIERGVRICEKSIISAIHVRSLISNKGSFDINDSTVVRIIDISQAQLSGGISVRNDSIIDAKVKFENVACGSIVFTGSNFKKDIHIWAGQIGSLTFNEGIFEDDLKIVAVPITSYLTVIGTDFKKSISFTLKDVAANKVGSFNKVYIRSGKFGEQFIINGDNCQIEELTIDTSKQLEGDLYFDSCNVLLANVSGSNYKSNIVFNNSCFNKINFDKFYNYSTLSLISVKAFNQNSEFIIAHSNLGKTHLFNAFLNTFDNIKIYNSVLTEIIVANVKWFDDNKLNANISASSEEYTYKKEIYRQIKFALEKQGDRITSLSFKALEMSAFKNESFAKVKWHRRIFSIDRFILWVGQTNNFGQNWVKPVMFAIGFSLIFYFLVVVGISKNLSYSFNFSKESIQLTWSELARFHNIIPQLMNPANTLSKILPDNIEISFAVNLWDYLLKIFLAFFIFQIISAFRKYMK